MTIVERFESKEKSYEEYQSFSTDHDWDGRESELDNSIIFSKNKMILLNNSDGEGVEFSFLNNEYKSTELESVQVLKRRYGKYYPQGAKCNI